MSSPVAHAVRLGLSRGAIETRHSLTNAQDLMWYFLMNGIFVAVMIFQRNSEIEGTSLAAFTLPSLLGMSIAASGFMGVAQNLAFQREDGTLLRAKAIPNGMIGYLVSQLAMIALTMLFGLAILIVCGIFIVDGLGSVGPGGWLLLIGVTVLGLLATLPWGAVIGSVVKSAASGFGLTFLPISAITAISGIFYPITALAGWVQAIAQIFPIYWLGLGMRSALLPDSAVTAEIGDSWRHLEMTGVLAAWAVVGLLITPAILRRMARRESGSVMEARKERALHRGY